MRFLLLSVVTCIVLFAADIWRGRWSSENSGTVGDIRFALKPEPNVVFTIGDQEVKTTNVTARTQGDEFEIAFDFENQGYRMRSTIKGTMKDGKLDGKYATKSLEDGSAIDSGTVTASAH